MPCNASDSDSDSSSSSSVGGARGGFVWGNVDQTGALEHEEKTRYPEELRDNMEDNSVARDISISIMKSRSNPPSTSESGLAPINVPLILRDDYELAQQAQSDSSSDSEDFDADDVVPVPASASIVRPSSSISSRLPPAVIAQDVSSRQSSVHSAFNSLPVLGKDSDGSDILKFSDMYIGGAEPFIEGLIVTRPIQKVSASSVAEGAPPTHWTLGGDESVFLDPRSGDILLIDVLRFICQPPSQKQAAVFNDKFQVGQVGGDCTISRNDDEVLLSDSAFAPVEQFVWEDQINWAGAILPPDVRHPPSPKQKIAASVAGRSAPPFIADIDMAFDCGSTSASRPNPFDAAGLPVERDTIRLCMNRRRRKRSPTLLCGPSPNRDLVPFSCPISEPEITRCNSGVNSMIARCSIPRLNFDFESMSWLDRIIWDESAPGHPSLLTSLILDLNDDHMVFGSDGVEAREAAGAAQTDAVNRFNLSKDGIGLYQKAGVEERAIVGRAAVQHALFAQELSRPIYKSYFSEEELCWFHRPRVRLESAYILWRPVDRTKPAETGNARKYVPKKESELSGRDGRIVLAEYIEQHPPLIANIGMANELITFYRQKTPDDSFRPTVSDGIVKVLNPEKDDESPFIADVRCGSVVSSINCNMFAAPMFEHQVQSTDFLLTRSAKRTNWFIREIPALYVVGQIQPKVQVKTPNARDANAALKDMLSVFIYRLLRANPKLLIADVFEAFPTQSETAIRAKLKEVADFQRGGHESGCWILNPERAKLPSLSAIREMVTPENMCEYASMRAGQHRLEMLGIEALLLWTPQLSSIISKLRPGLLKRQLEFVEEELQLTPWNLTSNFVSALQGRCLLKLQGPGNPLGRGAGFSYIKAPHRFEADPTAPKIAPAKALTGTDKDLRKLNMQELFNALVSFGISEAHVKDLPRWNRVGLLRQLCSDATLNGESTQFGRFARQQRNTNRVQQQRFLKEAQKIFVRQCEVLKNPVPVALEDRSSDDEADEFAADLEDLLEDRSGSQENADSNMQNEKAEYEKFIREQEAKRRSSQSSSIPGDHVLEGERSENAVTPAPGAAVSKPKTIRRRLRRREVVCDADGVERERVTIIDDPEWIDAYLADQKDGGNRLKELEDKTVAGLASSHNDANAVADDTAPGAAPSKGGETKQGARPRKRLLPGTSGVRTAQRRLKELRNAGKPRAPRASRPRLPRTPVLGPNGKPMVKCSSCHQFGHTKSNRKCPNHPDHMVLKVTDQESKVTLSIAKVPTPKRGTGEAETAKPATAIATIDGEQPKPAPSTSQTSSSKKKKKRDRTMPSSDNFDIEVDQRGPKRRASFRRRGDPQITLNSFFNGAIDATNDVLGVQTFCKPVTDDIAPNYSRIVSKPMYMDLLKQKVRNCEYTSRSQFIDDLDLIRSNSALYNGPENVLTVHATIVVDAAKRFLSMNESVIAETERHLIEYQQQQKLLSKLSSAVDTLWAHPDSALFRFNVKKAYVPDYHLKIKTPISLAVMKERIERGEYDSLHAFLNDIDLLVQNAETYNGSAHPIAEQARRLRQISLDKLELEKPVRESESIAIQSASA